MQFWAAGSFFGRFRPPFMPRFMQRTPDHSLQPLATFRPIGKISVVFHKTSVRDHGRLPINLCNACHTTPKPEDLRDLDKIPRRPAQGTESIFVSVRHGSTNRQAFRYLNKIPLPPHKRRRTYCGKLFATFRQISKIPGILNKIPIQPHKRRRTYCR